MMEVGDINNAGDYTAKNTNYHGWAYEPKLVMFFLTRELAKRKDYTFHLAAGMEEAGAFDDIVMIYERPQNIMEYRFLQVKHSTNVNKKIPFGKLLAPKGDWSLPKYFASFLSIKNNTKFNGKNVILKDFVLWCNFDLVEETSSKQVAGLQFSKDIFDTYHDEAFPCEVLKFKKNFKGKSKICSVLKESDKEQLIQDADIQDFLDKLVFAVGQPDENKLDEIIKNEIIKVTGFRDLNCETAFNDFYSEVSKWVFASKGKTFKLKDAELFFNNVQQQLSNVTYYEKIKKYGVTFCNEVIADLGIIESVEKTETNLCIITNKFHSEMSSIKILQVLNELEKFRTNNYLLTCLSDFIHLKSSIVQYLEKKERAFLLVIECDVEVTDPKKMLELSDALKYFANLPEKTLVLISKENDEFVKTCRESITTCKEISDDKNNFCHLSAKSQTKLLETMVTFQGIQIQLKELIRFEKLKEIIDDETSYMLATKQGISLGCKLDSLREVADYYINRSVIRHVNISQEILKLDIPDLFAIGNVEESELMKILEDGKKKLGSSENELVHQSLRIPRRLDDSIKSTRKSLKTVETIYENLNSINSDALVNPDDKKFTRKYGEVDPNPEDPIRFIILTNENKNQCFRQLCLDYPKQTIHWVEKADNKLVWQQSRGSLSNIRQFLDKNVETGDAFEPKDLTDIASKLIIVNGEPGMGKSCLLSQLALQTQELDPSLWIVRLNLPDIDEKLSKSNAVNRNEITEEGVVNLFCKFRNRTKFEKNMFENALKTPERVILLFDGFDEISVKGRKCVIKLLRYFMHQPIKNTWVCTRPHAMYTLEDELSLFSYHLQLVTRDNQMTLLRKVWMTNLKIADDNEMRLTSFAKKLLDTFYDSINENNEMAFGIPLHSKMLAEAFEKECVEFYKSSKTTFGNLFGLNSFELYQHFVNRKTMLPFEEKWKVDTKSSSFQMRLGDLIKPCDHIHQLLAVHSHFSEKDISCVLSEDDKQLILRSTQNEDKTVLETGIIIGFANNMPVFIHSTFADYFSAKWFEDNRSRNEVGNLFLKYILNDESRAYSDDAFAAQTFRFMFKNIFGRPNPFSASTNIFNRSPFGLKEDTMYTFRRFFDHFLVERARKQRQRYNLYIAVLTNGSKTLTRILNKIENKDALNITEDIGKTPLHMAASHGYRDITDILLKNMADINICDDIFGWSALQYADAFMYWDIAVRLLDEGGVGEHMCNAVRLIKEGNNSLLHLAVELDSLRFVKLLTENGADINAFDSYGNSAVHNATREGQLDLLRYFVQVKGADFCKFNKRGFAPIHIAAGSLKLDVMECIANNNLPNIDQRNDTGLTALQILVTCDDKNEEFASLDIVNYLIETCHADVLVKTTTFNGSLLHLAAEFGKIKIVKYLIEKQNASCIASDVRGLTPVHCAAVRGHLDIVKYFAEIINVDFSMLARGKMSVLHTAALSGNLNLVKYLVEERNASCISTDVFECTPAHYAISTGKSDIAKYLLELKTFDVSILSFEKRSLVHFAAENGNLNLVKYLVDEQNVSCISADTSGFIPAHLAALEGNLDIVKYFLEIKKVDLDILTHDKRSLLHFAAGSGNLNLVKYLVEEQNVSCISTDAKGNAPAHLAALKGHLDIVKYFLEIKKVASSILTYDKHSFVHFAVLSENLNLVKYLVEEQNVSFISTDTKGYTPAHLAALKGKLDIVKYFLDLKKFDLGILSHDKLSLVHLAAESGNLNLVKYLVDEQNASCISADTSGYTPVHHAALEGHLDIVKYFLEIKMVELSILTYNKLSFVHIAAVSGNINLVKYLVEEQNASYISTNTKGYTPAHLAALKGKLDIVKYFIELKKFDLGILSHDKRTLVHHAAESGNLNLVKYLVEEQNARCTSADTIGFTPAHLAALKGDLNIVKYFIESKKFDLGILSLDKRSLVHLAAQSGNLNLVQYLVEKQNCNFDISNIYGISPLHCAARYGRANIIEYLIDNFEEIHSKSGIANGALRGTANINEPDVKSLVVQISTDVALTSRFINAYDINGNTPLIVACDCGEKQAASMLLKYGANYHCQDYLGHTALHLAIYHGHEEIVELLINHGANPINSTLLDIIVESKLYDDAASPEVISRIYQVYLGKSNEISVSICDHLSQYHSAVTNGDLNELELIMEKDGLDVNATDFYGRTPLERACEYGHLNIVRYFFEWRKSNLAIPQNEIMSLLFLSTAKGQLEIVKYLFGLVRSDVSNLLANSLFSNSIFSDCEEIISFLFHEKNIACDNFAAFSNTKSNMGSCFLITCAELGNLNSARAVLNLGDNVNAQNNLGETALHAAVKCEHPKFVKFLLDNRADASIADKNGKTPLDLANEIMEQPYGYHECVKYMADLLESYSGKL